jgi:hypothetical protein
MSKPWALEEAAAAGALAANREAIESSVRGIPAGRDKSRSTTARRGYVMITARWAASCIWCGRKIEPGRQVRYWFGQGVSCRSCPSDTERGG